jgi:hypothetical protein
MAGAAAAAIMFSGQAFAEGVAVQIEPAQRQTIKQYVVRENVPAVKVKERVRVGATLPADVELRDVPADWGPSVSRYKYVYSDNGVHFIDPTSRRVIYDID